MLREFKQIKQETGPGSRRWFESDGFDLIVWLDHAGTVTGFQICYDFGDGEHALTWRRGEGCTHHVVDRGDALPTRDETPILIPDSRVPWDSLERAFATHSTGLEVALRELVRSTLAERPALRRTV